MFEGARTERGAPRFFFSDPCNPEVFVKVLDFGSDRPFLLFWAGLTDLEYTLTFTNQATFTKPSGGYGGFADATSLPR